MAPNPVGLGVPVQMGTPSSSQGWGPAVLMTVWERTGNACSSSRPVALARSPHPPALFQVSLCLRPRPEGRLALRAGLACLVQRRPLRRSGSPSETLWHLHAVPQVTVWGAADSATRGAWAGEASHSLP